MQLVPSQYSFDGYNLYNSRLKREFVSIISTLTGYYDDNPDVASYVVGLTVHPVMGIPYSDANAALFRDATPGSTFDVQMNTGATLRFRCVAQRTISRGDTDLFSQAEPGLTLVLLGEQATEPDEQTGVRLALVASYLPDEQNGVNSIVLPTVAFPTVTPSPTPAERIDAQIISATTQTGRLTLRLRIFNSQTRPLLLDSSSIHLVYGYTERPMGPHIAAELAPTTLEVGQAADLTLVFAWHGEPFALLSVVNVYQYALMVG